MDMLVAQAMQGLDALVPTFEWIKVFSSFPRAKINYISFNIKGI